MQERSRIAIWAAVSSRPQAEKDSIPDQLAAGRAFVAARNGILVVELVVPGQSRSYPTIAEAIEGMGQGNAYQRLLDLLGQKAIDLLWCRALDRIGRTDPIIAEVQWRCQQAGVQVWSEQMPPTGQATGDLYLSAIERAGAQKEVMEIKRRAHYGMNARARHGHMMATRHVPFGYRAEYVGRVRVAVVDPAQAAAFRWMVEAFLSRSHTDAEIAARLRELFPERKWGQGVVRDLLRNKFYTGVVVRNAKTPDGQMRIEAEGQHQPLLDMETWHEIQSYLDARSAGRRPPAKTLWAGLLTCDYCGSRMYAHVNYGRSTPHVYYMCSARVRYKTCENLNHTPETAITPAVAQYLSELYEKNRGDLSELLDAFEPDSAHTLEELERQRAALVQRRDRLTMLFQLDRISLEEFDGQRKGISTELDAVDGELTAMRAREETRSRRQDAVEILGAIIPSLEQRLALADPVEANRWLRGIFAEIRIRDKKIVRVAVV